MAEAPSEVVPPGDASRVLRTTQYVRAGGSGCRPSSTIAGAPPDKPATIGW